MNARPIKVTFLAHSLRMGGAEVQLAALATGIDRSRFAPGLVSIYGDGELLQTVRDAGLPVTVTGKHGRYDVAGMFTRIVKALRATSPDIVYSYLDLPNLIAGMARPFLRGSRLVWGVRASDMNLHERGMDWRLIFGAERLLARRIDAIVCNSWAGREHLVASGFPPAPILVQPNGIDCGRHAPDSEARARVRAELGLSDTEIAIGLVGRLDPMKDHPNFLRAASMIASDSPGLRFVCVGGGPDSYLSELKALAADLGVADRLIWTGARVDVPALYNAFDIATLSSRYGEGFPNVVGEAMATGLPCVVTDVGDAARVVGENGIVVPISEPDALAEGWRSILALDPNARRDYGARARRRIETEYPMQAMIAGSEAILRSLHEGRPLPNAQVAGQAS